MEYDDKDQNNSSDKPGEEIYESDESEFTNKEMNGCANEEIAQDSKNNSRSTKLKSLVGIIQIPNQ